MDTGFRVYKLATSNLKPWQPGEHLAADLLDAATNVLPGRSEDDLLVELLGSGRRTRSRADLVLALRGESHVTTYVVTEADRHAVALHIAHLRTKLGDTGSRQRFIETVEGVGYRMVVS